LAKGIKCLHFRAKVAQLSGHLPIAIKQPTLRYLYPRDASIVLLSNVLVLNVFVPIVFVPPVLVPILVLIVFVSLALVPVLVLLVLVASLASDGAQTMTGAIVNASSGAVID
jgi:hypothetical protein